MTDLCTSGSTLPTIPDNVTIAQFMLDEQPSLFRRSYSSCLIDDKSGKVVTLEELRDDTRALAAALQSRYNLGENSISMIISPNHTDYPVSMWAIHRLGGIITFSNPQFTADELAYQLEVARVTFIIVHSAVLQAAVSAAQLVNLPLDRVILLDHTAESLHFDTFRIPTVRELIAEGYKWKSTVNEQTLTAGEGKSKIALLCWSSGTTGKPKAVAISHYAFIANIIQMAVHNHVGSDHSPYRPGDVALGALPFFHVAGLVINLHFVLFCGMKVVVLQKYNFLEVLNSIERHRITHLHLVPPQSIAFCKDPAVKDYDLSLIRYVMIGAAPVSQEVQEQLAGVFPTAQIGQAYGMTEMTTVLAMVGPTQKRGPLGSGGRLLPGIEARVLKPDGDEASYGEPGELVVRGPSAALGYFNNQKATRETFVDGWVYTGDEVIITHDNEVFVFDRLKEFIKVRGFQVAPAELEGCLLDHPDVIDTCVVGVPDSYSGEQPLAFVVLSEDAVARVSRNPRAADMIIESILKHVANKKARYKHLTGGVYLTDSIPRNGSGKLLRRILRAKARKELNCQEVVRARL